jgi:hypothetical protein
MADPLPTRSDVSGGTYRCTDSGYELSGASTKEPAAGSGLLKRLVAHGDRRGQRQ